MCSVYSWWNDAYCSLYDNNLQNYYLFQCKKIVMVSCLVRAMQPLNPPVHFDIKFQYPVYMSNPINSNMISITHKHTNILFCLLLHWWNNGYKRIYELARKHIEIFNHCNDIKLLLLSILKNAYLLLYLLVDKQIQRSAWMDHVNYGR